MVLSELGRKLNAALSSLNRAPVVDEKVGPRYAFKLIVVNLLQGSRCNFKGNHCCTLGNRRQCKTRSIPSPKGQGKGQSLSRGQFWRQIQRKQPEECHS